MKRIILALLAALALGVHAQTVTQTLTTYYTVAPPAGAASASAGPYQYLDGCRAAAKAEALSLQQTTDRWCWQLVRSTFKPKAGTPPPPVIGNATITWEAPTLNADGTPLTDLAGYRVKWGMAQGVYTQTLDVTGTSTVVQNLPAGTYYFTVTALDALANESAPATPASKTIK